MAEDAQVERLASCMNRAGRELDNDQIRHLYTLHMSTLSGIPSTVMKRVWSRMTIPSKKRLCKQYPPLKGLCPNPSSGRVTFGENQIREISPRQRVVSDDE